MIEQDGDERLGGLTAYALALALPHLQEGNEPSPFLVTETGEGERLVNKFVMFEGEEAVRAAYRKAGEARPEVAYAVVLYCGSIDLQDGAGSGPTIVMATHQRALPRAAIVAYKYRPKGLLRGFKLLGEPVAVSEDADPILTPVGR